MITIEVQDNVRELVNLKNKVSKLWTELSKLGGITHQQLDYLHEIEDSLTFRIGQYADIAIRDADVKV